MIVFKHKNTLPGMMSDPIFPAEGLFICKCGSHRKEREIISVMMLLPEGLRNHCQPEMMMTKPYSVRLPASSPQVRWATTTAKTTEPPGDFGLTGRILH
jgi:hypothetical protein